MALLRPQGGQAKEMRIKWYKFWEPQESDHRTLSLQWQYRSRLGREEEKNAPRQRGIVITVLKLGIILWLWNLLNFKQKHFLS